MQAKKVFFALILAISAVTFSSCDDHDYNLINPKSLPPQALTFINTYFYNDYVDYVREYGHGNRTTYGVYFDSGAVAYFDAWGAWYEVSAPYGYQLPYGIAPRNIYNYIYAYWPYEGINTISTDYYGYEVTLTNGYTLQFNTQGYPI